MRAEKRVEEDRELHAPTQCPFCLSRAVAATSHKITRASYWRCDTCGQLWNPERLVPRFAAPRRYP